MNTANVRNLLNTGEQQKSQLLAQDTARDLVDSLLADHKRGPLKGQTVESLLTTNKEEANKVVFLLGKAVLKFDRGGVKQLKTVLQTAIKAKPNLTVEEFFTELSNGIKTRVGAPEFQQWETEYTNKHPEGLDSDQMKARMDAQTEVMSEVLQTKWTINTYRYALHVIKDIKAKFAGNPKEIATRIINYLLGTRSKNWLKNNRLANRMKAGWRNKGVLRSGLERKNLDKVVKDVVESMALLPDEKGANGTPNKKGIAKMAVAKELEGAYNTVRNEDRVDENAFDLAA